jgi:hypothetical protein
LLFVGDDWAEDHHDVEVQDVTGRRLAKARLPEGVAAIGRLHELIGQLAGEDMPAEQVLVRIETDRGPWVVALVAAGYTVSRARCDPRGPGARRVRRRSRPLRWRPGTQEL